MSGSDRTVVVTGAAGLLGRHLCADLARRGWQVRALVRDPGRFAAPVRGAPVGRCALPQTVDETLFAGADVVIHAAWATRERDPEQARRVNEDGTRRVLECARRAEVAHFVFLSSLIAHPEGASFYARSKHAAEQLLDPERDLALRPGLVLAREGRSLFQQMQAAVRGLRVVPSFGGGGQPLQTVHVDDLCEAVARSLERRVVGRLTVAERETIALDAFVEAIAERMGVRCVRLALPFAPVLAAVRTLEALGLPSPLGAESLLGLKALRRVSVEEDLARIELDVRSALASLDELLGADQ